MQDLSSTPTDQLNKSDKSNIANKGLTAAGASLLASELMILGDGGEGVNNSSTGGGNVSGAGLLRRAAGTGDGSDQKFKSNNDGKSGGHTCTCTCIFIIGIPLWQNLTVKEVLSDLQLENLFEIFEREQVSELIYQYSTVSVLC